MLIPCYESGKGAEIFLKFLSCTKCIFIVQRIGAMQYLSGTGMKIFNSYVVR